MIRGIIRRFIGVSNPVVVTIPGDKVAEAIPDRGLRPEAGVAHQIGYVGKGFSYVSGAASATSAAELVLQNGDYIFVLVGEVNVGAMRHLVWRDMAPCPA
jgi:hypothetical protein